MNKQRRENCKRSGSDRIEFRIQIRKYTKADIVRSDSRKICTVLNIVSCAVRQCGASAVCVVVTNTEIVAEAVILFDISRICLIQDQPQLLCEKQDTAYQIEFKSNIILHKQVIIFKNFIFLCNPLRFVRTKYFLRFFYSVSTSPEIIFHFKGIKRHQIRTFLMTR